MAEFISTFIFVFVGEGSVLALDKMYPEEARYYREMRASTLVTMALAHGLALFATIAASINISGGHVNPAITLAAGEVLLGVGRRRASPAIGLVLAANILIGAHSMNPVRAFGPALVGWRWRHHWIYWLGPFVGSGLAGLMYEFLMVLTEVAHHTHTQLASQDY